MIDRGRPMAPSGPRTTEDWERLVAAGQATERVAATDPRTIVPADKGLDVSTRLAAQRDDER